MDMNFSDSVRESQDIGYPLMMIFSMMALDTAFFTSACNFRGTLLNSITMLFDDICSGVKIA